MNGFRPRILGHSYSGTEDFSHSFFFFRSFKPSLLGIEDKWVKPTESVPLPCDPFWIQIFFVHTTCLVDCVSTGTSTFTALFFCLLFISNIFLLL